MTLKLLLVLIETKDDRQPAEGLTSDERIEIARIYSMLGIYESRFYLNVGSSTDTPLLGASIAPVSRVTDLPRLATYLAESPFLDALRIRAARLYDPYQSYELVTPSDKKIGHRLVINAMTPSPFSEDSFNSWYAEEHVPLLSAVPFWISSNRYILAETSPLEHDAPTYLALHEWADDKAFKTPEFRKATGTPWRTEVIGQVVKKERWVVEFRESWVVSLD